MNKPIQPFVFDMLQLPAMIDHIRDSFQAACIDVYRMENRLVYIFRWEEPSEHDDDLHRDTRALVVEEVDEFRLLEYIIANCRFVKPDRNNAPRLFAPPAKLAAHFRSAKDRWRFRVLNGVIQAPTLRKDGTLLVKEGYDAASGLYLNLDGANYSEIKDKPTKDDALAALAILKEPFEEFPFVEEDFQCPSLSVALSAVLTGLIRRTLRSAPLHGFDAPEAGSGKGLACSVVTIIVSGNRATAINFSTTDTEFRKLLFSALLANDQVIVLDNIARPLEGESLNSALTEETIGDRILGISQNARVPTNALFLANGNNLQVKGDMHRRIIAARIDAGERPEERRFKRPNLLAWVEKDRPNLVAAGLTILRAYEVAGRPRVMELPEFGSFEEWTARVRNALVWLGEDDPCMTRERFRTAEPGLEALGAILRAIHSERGEEWFTSGDLVKKAEEYNDDGNPIADALNSGAIVADAVAVGKYLTKSEGRTKDGLKLMMGYDNHAKRRIFRVTKIR